MAIIVRLHGRFKDLAPELDASEAIGLLSLESDEFDGTRIADVMGRLGIDEDDVSHLFLNGDYSKTSRTISDGDRLAIWPREMGLLYKWYFDKSE